MLLRQMLESQPVNQEYFRKLASFLRRGWSIRAFWPKPSVHGQETQRLSPKVPSSFKKRDKWFECVKYDYHNWSTLKQTISESWSDQNMFWHVLTKDWIPQDCFRTGGVGEPACLSCNKSHTGVTWVWAILLTASISVRSDLDCCMHTGHTPMKPPTTAAATAITVSSSSSSSSTSSSSSLSWSSPS